MRNYPRTLKRKILETISQQREELPRYTQDSKRDFTRKRKLPFETLCRTILSMSGQSLNVELQRQFHYEPAAATASAFVQQRRKLHPSVFEDILRRFTFRNRPKQRWNGYALLAVDGSHVQIPSDIHDKATYFNNTKDGRGYNLLHLNALYDLESQLFLDAVIQNGREEHESRALVELVDRSELTEPVILIADRGYGAYNNIAHIEQKGWNYLIRVKEKQGILSGLNLPDTPEFDACFSYSLSKRLTNRIRKELQKYRWLPNKVQFDYIRDASDDLYLLSFRVVRFLVKEDLYETVITNLPEARFPPSLLRMLYHKRWGDRNCFPRFEIHPCAEALSRKKALIHYAGDFCKNDALQFRVPASAAHQICAAKGEIFLPCERCFCRAYCTGVPARICTCGQCGGTDC